MAFLGNRRVLPMNPETRTSAEIERAILDAEDRRQAALVAVDLPTLGELFAEDLIHIHSNGLVHDKAQLLHHVEQRRSFRRIDRGPLTVRVAGNTALLLGAMTNHMTIDGVARVLEGVVAQVLRRDVDGWRFVLFQFTKTGK